MDKKIIAIIVGAIALVGGMSAYSAAVLSPKNDGAPAGSEPEINSVNGAKVDREFGETELSSIRQEDDAGSGNDTGDDDNATNSTEGIIQSGRGNNNDDYYGNRTEDSGLGIINNSTILANDTIITINKPVYENNTLVYQPVTINLKDYSKVITENTVNKEDNDNKITIDDSTINSNNDNDNDDSSSHTTQQETSVKQDDNDDSKQKTEKTYKLTINAKRIPSDGWSDRFTDDDVGMFVSVYDLKGKQIKTGFADEDGFTVKNLENKLYFVYPADCKDCENSDNDIMFQSWEDGSNDRPRLVPAGSEITASYGLVTLEKSSSDDDKPKTAGSSSPSNDSDGDNNNGTEPSSSTSTDESTSEPKISSLTATATSYVYGLVQVNGEVSGVASTGSGQVEVQVSAPNGTLIQANKFDISGSSGKFQDTFFTARQAGEGDYKIVAMYDYGSDIATKEIAYHAKFEIPKVSLFVQKMNLGTISVTGNAAGALAHEKMLIEVFDPDNNFIGDFDYQFGTKPTIGFIIGQDDVKDLFTEPGEYRFVATHVLTGAQGEARLSYSVSESQDGETENAAGANDNGTEQQQENQTGSAASSGENGSNIINLSNDGKSKDSQVAISGDDVYVVWVSGDEILFAKSSDGGDTFAEPMQISDASAWSLFPTIQAAGDGNVYVAWEDYDDSEQSAVAFRASTDGGSTFGDIVMLSNHTGELANPQIATVNEDNVYVMWTSGAYEEFAGKILFASSSDGGKTFSDPQQLNHDWADEGRLAAASATSSDGDDDGTVYAVWTEYSTKDPADSDSATTLIASSSDGGDIFGEPIEITGDAGFTSSLTLSGGNIYLLWTGNADGANDLFYSNSEADSEANFQQMQNLSEDESDVFGGALAVHGDDVFVVYDTDKSPVFLHSSDNGQTFSVMDGEGSALDGKEGSHSHDIAASEDNLYSTWTQTGNSSSSDVFFAKNPYS